MNMPLLMRVVTYASLFIGLVLVFLPARLLLWAGVAPPQSLGVFQIGGIALAVGGAGLALWCVGTFVRVGRGTPAPFDPPRRLVVAGPYRFVRNICSLFFMKSRRWSGVLGGSIGSTVRRWGGGCRGGVRPGF